MTAKTMSIAKFILPLAALTVISGQALAQEGQGEAPAAESKEARPPSIPFVNHGGVRDWHAEGRSTVYIQDSHRQWYRAELFSPASDLPFVHYIGIDGGATDLLDKWGAIYVNGQRYPFTSFEKVAGEKPWIAAAVAPGE